MVFLWISAIFPQPGLAAAARAAGLRPSAAAPPGADAVGREAAQEALQQWTRGETLGKP